MNLSMWEILFIGLIVVLLFGTKKIPELFTGLGTGIRNFKKALSEDPEEAKRKELPTLPSKE
ncbi:MAG: twin-arginine translocase TatA/TatE family subunit [Chloracidobacterium sp.]|nr:twin-arginine translocase TatA/TatE family subunit [Chloracidobacterium sp.]MDW8217344.1 twin-arginine translocase TatA/TatE family subunit [Acidobacteriota bacterium]